ncbi:signal recognition particle-docking protein FtsY, partial [Salmonella enterica subsp. arizonae]|nr:signal recognition particle-docking protein FtsY [Salmonella enterica subsp. arizonae]
MAKEKKRGFFSWLGFGQKEQAPENETEVKNEDKQSVVEEAAAVHAPKTHTEAESEAFAAEVVDVTEQVAESEKQPSQPEPTVVAAAIEREELPLPEDVSQQAVEEAQVETISPQEWQAEAETVEVIEAVEEEGEKAAKFTDEELEAQALAAQATEDAVMVVP